MNILFYCPFNFSLDSSNLRSLGGIESLNIELCKYLSKSKHEIFLASYCKKIIKKKNFTNIPIRILKEKKLSFKFDKIISSNEPEIFNHFKFTKNFLWLHNKLPIEKALRKNKFFPILRNKISAIFVSNFLLNHTSSIYNFEKKIIIPNFLDPEFKFSNLNFQRRPYFVWSVSRSKGLYEIIQLWKKDIFSKNHNLKLFVFGIDKKNLDIKNLNLYNKFNIFFMGRVSKQKLITYYKKSMAMICLGHDETFCLNAIEAFACGLPIITFAYTSLSELSKRKNSFIINDYEDLPKTIFKIVNFNIYKRLDLINNCKNFSNKFNIDKISLLWNKILFT